MLSNRRALLKVIALSMSLAIFGIARSADDQMANAQRKAKVSLSAQVSLQRLHTIAEADATTSGEVDAGARQARLAYEIAKIIDRIGDSEELGLLARLSHVLSYPDTAETVRYDEVYSLAYEQSVSRLRKMKSKKSELELSLIREQFNLRGHALELFESL